MDPGTDGLGVTTLCCCWEGDKHWFGSTVVVRREKKPLSKALESFPWKNVQVLDWSYLSCFVGWHLALMALWDSSVTLLFQRAPSAALPRC